MTMKARGIVPLMASLGWTKIAVAGIGLALGTLPTLAQETAPAPTEEIRAVDLAPEEEHDDGHEEGGIPHYPLEKPERLDWSFGGPFGTYDAAQLQRGLQVYQQVCALCHGLELVAFRTLAAETGPFLTEEQMREVAAGIQVVDGETGARRPARPADYFPPSPAFGASKPAPDLSLMAKARGVAYPFPAFLVDAIIPYQENGADYIHALLTGYAEAPEGTVVPPGTWYNPYFVSGTAIGMPPPLTDGRVNYADESIPETVDQYARDVAAFLMWTAEPKLNERKQLGFQAIVFLLIFAVLLYLAKRQVWRNVKH